MVELIPRNKDLNQLLHLIEHFPVTAILGPRQCGKSTMAKWVKYDHYFDLENPLDEKQFDNPQLTLSRIKGLIVIDEIQRAPELFPLLRFLVDNNPDKKFLILGSASRDLIQQSSESLAGRIAFFNLAGFRFSDLAGANLSNHWFRGTLPPSLLAKSTQISNIWRINYIKTFLERDIPRLGINIPAKTLRRFWMMLSHYHGQLLNYSELARSFGMSDKTIRHYLEILENTFMIKLLPPWYVNIKKRLVKAPKLYIRDSGIFHSLQAIESENELYTHPKLGASWEGYVIEEAVKILSKEDVYFWKTHNGTEIDLFWQSHGKNWSLEVKYSDAPSLTRSYLQAIDDLYLSRLWIVYPGEKEYYLHEKITVLPFRRLPSIKQD